MSAPPRVSGLRLPLSIPGRLGLALTLAAVFVGCDVFGGFDESEVMWRTLPNPYGDLSMTVSADPSGTLYAFPSRTSRIPDANLYERRWRMYVSEDRGATWDGIEHGFDIDAFAVLGTDTLLAQSGNSFRRSTDGGASWSVVSLPPGSHYGFERSVSFSVGPSGQVAVVTDRTESLYRSPDYGRTWERVALPDGNVITEAFAGPTPSTFFRDTGRLYRTADGGVSWSEVGPGISDMAQNRAGTLVSVGANGVMASTDAGATWSRMSWEAGLRIVALDDGFAVLTHSHDVLKLDGDGRVVGAHPSRYDTEGGVAPQPREGHFSADGEGHVYLSVRPHAEANLRLSLATVEAL